MRRMGLNGWLSVLIALGACSIHWQAAASAADSPTPDPLTRTGQIVVDGRSMPYLIHYLPPSSFPGLPGVVVATLNQRGCLVPQTYEAHRPENVIHGSFERIGSSDWAMLCSAHGAVGLLVFFSSALDRPMTLFAMPETDRLQADGGRPVLGFNWGIDSASPQRIHDAQTGMEHRPPRPDHDAIASSVADHGVTYYLYTPSGKWTVVDLPEP